MRRILSSTMPHTLRPAEKTDYGRLFSLVNSMGYLHRHLDWRDTLEWLGRPPFWLLEEQDELVATLSCAPEPEEVAWVRLFASAMHTSIDRAWQRLFEPTLEELHTFSPRPALVSLALRDWYEDLLRRNGFTHHQDIVVFLFDQSPPSAPRLDSDYQMREMTAEDLETIAVVDHRSFEPIWRLSTDDLRFAARKSSYCTVIEREGQVIAYQMSSSNGMYAHLARLAVLPELQGQRLGFALVQNLLDHYINRLGFWGVTLNTQHNNPSSFALYNKVGFHQTGERFPVFIYAK